MTVNNPQAVNFFTSSKVNIFEILYDSIHVNLDHVRNVHSTELPHIINHLTYYALPVILY